MYILLEKEASKRFDLISGSGFCKYLKKGFEGMDG
jgi:hypothetical protein